MTISTGQTDTPSVDGKRIVAVFACRDDAHLVGPMLENVSPSVQAWVGWDDRPYAPDQFAEPARRHLLLAQAAALKADWVLAIDPDERFEPALASRISALVAATGTAWTFQLRELYTPDSYRSDGLWAKKTVLRLFPLHGQPGPEQRTFHGSWIAPDSALRRKPSGLDLYHLRMMTAVRRSHRRDSYALRDPGRRDQKIGYDYLDDMRGAVLTTIPPDRRFLPPHVEDHGLWAPQLPDGQPAPDPLPARLNYLRMARLPDGEVGAAAMAEDAADQHPTDSDLALLAAEASLRAGDPIRARSRLEAVLAADPRQTMARVLLARAWRAAGRNDLAGDISLATCRQEPTSLIAGQEDQAPPESGRALWRRWVSGAAVCQTGADYRTDAPICVIVIGHRAPDSLARAVASIRRDDPSAEIVVVNTGGGRPDAVLRDHLTSIRLIAVDESLFVGAARNIGIDASSAAIVSFLADDCTAAPGWIAGRLARHGAGARAVASAVGPARPRHPVALAANAMIYWRRWPRAEADPLTLHGLSFDRDLFRRYGYFPPGLRIGEDTAMVSRIAGEVRIDWAPEVLTLHQDPVRLTDFLRDLDARARRRSAVPRFLALRGQADTDARLRALSRNRARQAIAALPDLAGPGWAARKIAALLLRLAPLVERRAMRQAFARTAADHDTRLLAKDWLAEADRAEAAGDPDAALEATARACALEPLAHGALGRLVARLQAAGRSAEAADRAEMAALSAPHMVELWLVAQRAVIATRDFPRNRTLLQAALIAEPANPSVHRLLRQAHTLLGQTELSRLRDATASALDQFGQDAPRPTLPPAPSGCSDASSSPHAARPSGPSADRPHPGAVPPS